MDAALLELGWLDALAADPRAAVSLLFELQGWANVNSSALDLLLARALGYEDGCVLLPPMATWHPPAQLEGGCLRVRGVGTHALAVGQPLIVVASVAESAVAFVVDQGSLIQRSVEGVDAAMGLTLFSGEVAGGRELGPADWAGAVATGQIALGHQMVGASRRMLELARQHALDRIQFGQPIAKFQAVRHRLADALVAIEAASAALDAAWLDGTPQVAAMAKATAGRGARGASRHCQQVLAGMGFTTEHPLHLYIRRVLVLEQLLGATRGLTRQLGYEILESGDLPPMPPL